MPTQASFSLVDPAAEFNILSPFSSPSSPHLFASPPVVSAVVYIPLQGWCTRFLAIVLSAANDSHLHFFPENCPHSTWAVLPRDAGAIMLFLPHLPVSHSHKWLTWSTKSSSLVSERDKPCGAFMFQNSLKDQTETRLRGTHFFYWLPPLSYHPASLTAPNKSFAQESLLSGSESREPNLRYPCVQSWLPQGFPTTSNSHTSYPGPCRLHFLQEAFLGLDSCTLAACSFNMEFGCLSWPDMVLTPLCVLGYWILPIYSYRWRNWGSEVERLTHKVLGTGEDLSYFKPLYLTTRLYTLY